MEARPAHLVAQYTPQPQPVHHTRRAYRPKEVAELYGLGLQTVYDALSRGDLAGRQVGRSWVIPVEAIEDWLNGGAAAS